jgi:Protein of unknown function (DUF1778)
VYVEMYLESERPMSPEALAIAKLKMLSLTRQQEVLDFIEFLEAKEQREGETLILSDRDRDQFLQALDQPPVQNGVLKEALSQHRQIYGNA